MKDYYKILGVEKSASKDEIKKAFRKQAHQFHPDKTKNDAVAGQKFKEASEAYSVLSDDQKRKQYDMFGSAGPGGGGFNGQGGFGGQGGFNSQDFAGFDFSGFQQGNGGVEFDLGDIFGDLFGGGRNRQARQPRGRDISIDIQISFEESIFGVERDILVTKASKCLTCEGSGAAAGSTMITCNTCNGKGKVNETRRSFIGVFSTTSVCNTCHGLGQVPKVKCSTCHGQGVAERQQEISVRIPAGIEDGEMVRLGGMGEAIPFGVTGDLYVKIHVKPHQMIRKEGLNLVTELGIKLTQALTGGTVMLETLDGALELQIPEASNTGDVLRIKGKGVPNERGKRGDLLVRLNIVMPKKLSKDAKKAIEELKKEGL
jgi:molecular chaperone DnaJ